MSLIIWDFSAGQVNTSLWFFKNPCQFLHRSSLRGHLQFCFFPPILKATFYSIDLWKIINIFGYWEFFSWILWRKLLYIYIYIYITIDFFVTIACFAIFSCNTSIIQLYNCTHIMKSTLDRVLNMLD